MSATSGVTTTVRPPSTTAGTWKHTDLPPPVGSTASTSRPESTDSTTAVCDGRKSGWPKRWRRTRRADASEAMPEHGLDYVASGNPAHAARFGETPGATDR